MSKKNQDNKVIPNDENLKRAWKNYVVGNFYTARSLAKKILASSDSLVTSKNQASNILTMTSVDPWGLLAGFLVLVCTIIIAFVVAY